MVLFAMQKADNEGFDSGERTCLFPVIKVSCRKVSQQINIDNNKMKRSKLIIFIVSFITYIVIAVLFAHNFESRGVPPQTWSEIMTDWPFFLISGTFIAALCTCLIDIEKKVK